MIVSSMLYKRIKKCLKNLLCCGKVVVTEVVVSFCLVDVAAVTVFVVVFTDFWAAGVVVRTVDCTVVVAENKIKSRNKGQIGYTFVSRSVQSKPRNINL